MSHPLLCVSPAGSNRSIEIICTERADGDIHPLRVPPPLLADRQRTITGRRWWMLDQVHGVDSVRVPRGVGPATEAEMPAVAAVGDVIITTSVDVDVAIWAADCSPVVLVGQSGAVVLAHGGWRGLAAGVLDVAVQQMQMVANHVVAAVLGPVIHPCCCEFGPAELQAVADGVGVDIAAVTGRTSAHAEALDVPAAVSAGLGRHGIDLDVVGPCTACDERFFSHRAGPDAERHAVVASIASVTP